MPVFATGFLRNEPSAAAAAAHDSDAAFGIGSGDPMGGSGCPLPIGSLVRRLLVIVDVDGEGVFSAARLSMDQPQLFARMEAEFSDCGSVTLDFSNKEDLEGARVWPDPVGVADGGCIGKLEEDWRLIVVLPMDPVVRADDWKFSDGAAEVLSSTTAG